MRRVRGQRAQSIVEFSLVAPVLLLVLFGVLDFGRAMYYYVTLQQAANEGVRVAIRASNYTDGGGTLHALPTNADVEAAVQQRAPNTYLANPCVNGPVDTSQVPPANQGWIYVTDPTGSSTTVNAPGGQPGGGAYGACNGASPALGHVPLRVTLRFNFVPLTPLISQLTTNQIVLTAYAIYRTEY